MKNKIFQCQINDVNSYYINNFTISFLNQMNDFNFNSNIIKIIYDNLINNNFMY